MLFIISEHKIVATVFSCLKILGGYGPLYLSKATWITFKIHISSVLAFPRYRTYDLGIASTVLYCLWDITYLVHKDSEFSGIVRPNLNYVFYFHALSPAGKLGEQWTGPAEASGGSEWGAQTDPEQQKQPSDTAWTSSERRHCSSRSAPTWFLSKLGSTL